MNGRKTGILESPGWREFLKDDALNRKLDHGAATDIG